MEELPFAAAWSADGTRLTLSGVVGEQSTHALREALLSGVPGVDAVVDLTAVQYLPSVAISVLVRAQDSAAYPIEFAARRNTIAQRVLAIAGVPHREL